MTTGRRNFLIGLGALSVAPGLARPAFAQGTPSWLEPGLHAKARSESGKVVVYSSVNEQEGLALWRLYEQASGIKVEYVRGSDTQLLARMAIEARAGQRSWDIVMSTAASRAPADFMLPLANRNMADFYDGILGANGRSIGYAANVNMPAYNTSLIKPGELPKSYEELAQKKEWAGRTAIDVGDIQWLSGMVRHFGEDRARKLLAEIVANLKPVITDGHLALARAVGAGEYAVAINNYVNLTNNVRINGNPTDYWPMEPIVVFYGQLGVSARAPNPNAAQLAIDFVLSHEGQTQLVTQGRVPVRRNVATNPPDLFQRIGNRQLVPVSLDGADEKKWTQMFAEIFRGRRSPT